jgi:hypothetical protein
MLIIFVTLIRPTICIFRNPTPFLQDDKIPCSSLFEHFIIPLLFLSYPLRQTHATQGKCCLI